MELEFDKEIDSLLRKNGEAKRGVLVGDKPDEKPKVHLDADQLSAFAENAIPERSRGLYMSHLADCDRCRRILSGLIALNGEAMPAEERVVAPAVTVSTAIEPWYRRLLLPNLAYVMGGLVLVFGGLIAFTVLQSSNSRDASISQVSSEAPAAARGPMYEDAQSVTDQMAANSNAASAVANKSASAPAANASSNAVSVANNLTAGVTTDEELRKEQRSDKDAKILTDGADVMQPSASAPVSAPPPPAITKPAPKGEAAAMSEAAPAESKDDESRSRSAKRKSAENEKSDLSMSSRQTQDLARTQAGGVAPSKPGPSRDAQQNFPNRADNTLDFYEERRISGKGFQRRNNVWYDNSYRSGPTTNIRRGTEEYRKLDSGLRTIAKSLSGVVVVVWKGKAYRIQ